MINTQRFCGGVFAPVKCTALLVITTFLAGCATRRDDPRLQGTWIFNREATLAEAPQHDPRWTNAPPEKIKRIKEMFGRGIMVIYSHGTETINYAASLHYRVAEQGSDYIIIRPAGQINTNLLAQLCWHDYRAVCSLVPAGKRRDLRIHFTNGNTKFGINTELLGLRIQERFNKLLPESAPAGSGGVLAPAPIPVDW